MRYTLEAKITDNGETVFQELQRNGAIPTIAPNGIKYIPFEEINEDGEVFFIGDAYEDGSVCGSNVEPWGEPEPDAFCKYRKEMEDYDGPD